MVHIHVPFPYATALFVATVEFACGAGPTLALLTPLCAAMLTGGMIVAVVTTSIHTIQATRVLAWLDDFPYRPEVLYVLTLVWLIFSGPGPYSIDGLASSEGPGVVPLSELVNRVSISRTGHVDTVELPTHIADMWVSIGARDCRFSVI